MQTDQDLARSVCESHPKPTRILGDLRQPKQIWISDGHTYYVYYRVKTLLKMGFDSSTRHVD